MGKTGLKLKNFLTDGWQNLLTMAGVENADAAVSTNYLRPKVRSRTEVESMYRGSAMFARIIDAVPDHSTRRWVRFEGRKADGSPADKGWSSQVSDALDEIEARESLEEALKNMRLEGTGYIVPIMDDGQDMAEPLNPEGIKSIESLEVVSRYDLTPSTFVRSTNSNEGSSDSKATDSLMTGKVLTYRLFGKHIHESRVIKLQEWIPLSSKTGGHAVDDTHALTIADRVYDPVRRYESVMLYVENAIKHINVGTLKINGLADSLSSGEEGDILGRMSVMSLVLSQFGMLLLDEDEEYQRIGGVLTGLSDSVEKVMDELGGASGMPLTILFGQTPKGFNTDDKAGMRNFNDMIAKQQRRHLRKPINRLANYVSVANKIESGDVSKSNVIFLPLEEPNDKEDAETQERKSKTDIDLVNGGIVSKEEARSRMMSDPSNPYPLDETTAPDLDDDEDTKPEEDTKPKEDVKPEEDNKEKETTKVDTDDDIGLSEGVQSSVLNGAQVSSALEIVKSYLTGEIPKESAQAMLQAMFGFDADVALTMLGPDEFLEKKAEEKEANKVAMDEQLKGNKDADNKGSSSKEDGDKHEDPANLPDNDSKPDDKLAE